MMVEQCVQHEPAPHRLIEILKSAIAQTMCAPHLHVYKYMMLVLYQTISPHASSRHRYICCQQMETNVDYKPET